MPEWLAIVLLGIIEGITEFLPISSTGHLLLVENTHLLPQQSELFNVVIQAGAVLAVFFVFSRRIRDLMQTLQEPRTRDYLSKLIVAFVITGVGGLLAKKAGLSLPKTVGPIAWATLVGGVLILVIEWWSRRKRLGAEITWTIAVAVGVAQLLAVVFPGTSRAGATIIVCAGARPRAPSGDRILVPARHPDPAGCERLRDLPELRHPGVDDPTSWNMVLLGAVVSAVVAFFVVKWLIRWVQTHDFVAFGWYRIALGLLMLAVGDRLR